jgi:hypothetical protein
MLVWRSCEKKTGCSSTRCSPVVCVHVHDDLQVSGVVQVSDDFVVAIRLGSSSEVRQGEQLHVAFFQHECGLELLDTDLDLLTGCSGSSSTCI